MKWSSLQNVMSKLTSTKFIRSTAEANTIKLFDAQLFTYLYKLVCLSLRVTFTLV